MSQFQFHILGRGAIGSLWASSLARAGFNTTLIPRQLDCPNYAINYISETETFTQSIAQQSPEQIEAIDILLVCVKSYQLEQALNSVANRITDKSTVILLQNGMGHQQLAESLLPQCQLLVATTTQGAYLSNDGLHHAGKGQTYLGPADNKTTIESSTFTMTRIPQWCQALNEALPDVIWQWDIQKRLWQKLAINAVINPLTALYRCKNGELLSNFEYRDHLQLIINDIQKVLEKACPEQDWTNLSEQVSQTAQKTASNVSSTLQDIVKGQATELPAICEYLINIAQNNNIAIPQYKKLYAQVNK